MITNYLKNFFSIGIVLFLFTYSTFAQSKLEVAQRFIEKAALEKSFFINIINS